MPSTRVNGVELYWELAGNQGEPLVLVHGSWGDHANWAAVVPGLARRFRVLTYDRRGHSRSERPPGQGSMDDDVADLAALVEQLGLAPAHVAGNSFGAAITLRLAGERPELFRSLIAHEPPALALLLGDPQLAPLVTAVRARIDAVVERIEADDMAGAARLFVESIAFGEGAWETLPAGMRETFTTNAPTFLDEIRDRTAGPGVVDLDLGRLARYAGPTLLTIGDQSPPFFPAIVERVAAALPHAARHTFAGSGHVPHVSDPGGYVDVVSRWIASQPRR